MSSFFGMGNDDEDDGRIVIIQTKMNPGIVRVNASLA
jgi:hypothetical protein